VYGAQTVRTGAKPMTDTPDDKARQTEWRTELHTCPVCGEKTEYKNWFGIEGLGDGNAIGEIQCENETCDFEAEETWTIEHTKRTVGKR